MINEVRTAFEFGLRERAQSWTLKVVGNSSIVSVGDKPLLWMAMANLIDNAIKYGRRNSEILTTVKYGDVGWIFSVENRGDYLDTRVEGDIFQAFVRGRMSDTSITRRQGTGLGLAVSRNIIEAHNSEVKTRISV